MNKSRMLIKSASNYNSWMYCCSGLYCSIKNRSNPKNHKRLVKKHQRNRELKQVERDWNKEFRLK